MFFEEKKLAPLFIYYYYITLHCIIIYLLSKGIGGIDSASSGKAQLVPFYLLMLNWVVSLPPLFSWMRNDLLSPGILGTSDLLTLLSQLM